jgi:hypothetical protein
MPEKPTYTRPSATIDEHAQRLATSDLPEPLMGIMRNNFHNMQRMDWMLQEQLDGPFLEREYELRLEIFRVLGITMITDEETVTQSTLATNS